MMFYNIKYAVESRGSVEKREETAFVLLMKSKFFVEKKRVIIAISIFQSAYNQKS